MRKLIIAALLIVPTLTMAQSDWQLPESTKAKAEQKAPAAKDKKKGIDPRYGVGMVPEVDGKVEWTHVIKMPGASIEQIYNHAIETLTELTQQPIQHEKSRLTAVNKAEHIVAAYLDENMVFSNYMLARDFTDFRYTIIATAKEGELEVKLCRISYAYEMKRETGTIYSAEELITDGNAMNKKKTKFYPLTGKFRKKTIDRKDEIFAMFEGK